MLRGIKSNAARLLQENNRAYQHLVRIHSLITVGAWLVLLVLSYFVSFLAPEGGLSNLGLHSMLFTAQVVLILIGLILMPFWETGLSYIALDFIRGKRNMPSDLWEGFRCLKPILGSMGFQGIQYALIYFIGSSATGVVLTLLPLSQAFYEDALTLLQKPSTPLEGRMLIVAAVYGIVFIGILLFLSSQLFYRYRMTRRIILDDENIGGMKASIESHKLMKGNKRNLIQLDLSFWWFYIPEFLGILLPISALLISSLEIPLPSGTEAILWTISAISLLLRLAVHYFAKSRITATYALFYEQLLNPESSPTVESGAQKVSSKEPPKPKRVPWQY